MSRLIFVMAVSCLLLPNANARPKPKQQSLAELIKQLKSPDEYVRATSVELIGKLGPKAKKARVEPCVPI